MPNAPLQRLAAGSAVTFTHYGERRTGRVIRDNGAGVVWIEDANAGPLFRERWMHRDSLTVLEGPAHA